MKKYRFYGKMFFLALLVLLNSQLWAQMMMGGGMMGNNEYDSVQYFNPVEKTGFTNKLNVPSDNGLLGFLDVTAPVKMKIAEQMLEIIPGKKTPLLAYVVEQDGKIFINPIIRVKKDSVFSLLLQNTMKEKTIIHWHGLKADSKNDGLPQYAIKSDTTYQYNFKISNEAGTFWYHPHPHGFTSKQAYLGLASMFIVNDTYSDALEEALKLKPGITDIPLVIQDKRFDKEGHLVYNPNRMEWFMGYYGDNILVNLTLKPYLEVGSRLYRFRILNASNARIYRLAFEKGTETFPFQIIAGDGGFLDKPYAAKELFMGAGERAEVLLDLSKEAKGTEIFLKSLAFDAMENEMGGGGMMSKMMDYMSGSSIQNGGAFNVMRLVVTEKVSADVKIPEKLADLPSLNAKDIKDTKVRKIAITQQNMQWLLNGKIYDMNEFPVEVKKGTKEIWEMTNANFSMPHPMHIHGFLFRVLDRKNSPPQVSQSALDKNGLTVMDMGYKDTVLVWPGETVRVLIDFTHNFAGAQDYVAHCHILEHEDAGMMFNYRVLEK